MSEQSLSQATSSVNTLPAAILLAVIGALLALLCLVLRNRTREAHYGWWSLAFWMLVLRTGAIVAFLATSNRDWLFWHQVITGWTALALLWAAIVFAHRVPWRGWYWAVIAFPPAWSYIAVFRLESFALAAGPAVLFLSLATLWTGRVLLAHRRGETAGASTLLGWTFILWGLHHLDYPILRARGSWMLWGYYVDMLFLLAVGAGILLLVNADLASRLRARTSDLERLSRRMVRQHEDERRRMSLELHDETSQVFAAVTLQLGIVREQVAPAVATQLDRALGLVDAGMKGVRRVTNDLRPALLDDLGLLPALRSLVAEFTERSGVQVTISVPAVLPPLAEEAEVALFRALQEALTNLVRHAPGAPAHVTVTVAANDVHLRIADSGPGIAGADALQRAEAAGHLGIAGMRERVHQLGGSLTVVSGSGKGVTIDVQLPILEGVLS